MNWLSYIFPRIIARASSKYNKDIRVVMESGQMKLLVNGYRESGSSIAEMYRKTFEYFEIGTQKKVKNILMLGVGGGSAIHMLKRLYPDAHIDAVDIDPVIIDLGKTHFGLGDVTYLKFFIRDAYDFVTSGQNKSTYNFIFVDLFIGNQVPDFVTDASFLSGIRNLQKSGGRLLINYSYADDYQEKSKKILKHLSGLYQNVKGYVINQNIEILAYSHL